MSKFDTKKIIKRSERKTIIDIEEKEETSPVESSRKKIIKRSEISSKKSYSFTSASNKIGSFTAKNVEDKEKVTEKIDDQVLKMQEAPKRNTELYLAQTKDFLSLEKIPTSFNIKYIKISSMSYEQIHAQSVVSITNSNFTGFGSINDPRLGPVSYNQACTHCGLIGCAGHFGVIDFKHMPIYNPNTLRDVIRVLTVVCNKCSKLLFSKRYLEENGIKGRGIEVLKKIEILAIKGSFCQNLTKFEKSKHTSDCGETCAINSKNEKAVIIRNIGEMKNKLRNVKIKEAEKKIIRETIEKEKLKLDKIECACETKKGQIKRCPQNFSFSIQDSKKNASIIYEVELNIDGKKIKSKHYFPIEEVIKIFENISKEDIKLMGFSEDASPINFIMKAIPVIPNSAKPANFVEGVESPHILSKKYVDVYNAANADPKIAIDQRRIKLYEAVASLLLEKDANVGKNAPGKQNIADYTSGKEGVIRKSLMGARGGQFFRTVASNDANLRADEVGVPEIFKRVLVKKIVVNNKNKKMAQHMFDNGKIVYIKRITGKFKGVLLNVKENMYKSGKIKLSNGDQVFRELRDGDIIVVNRHPTLHKNSLLSFRVVLGPGETVRFNLAITKGFNLDFDGDEANGWIPIDIEVDEEVMERMGVMNNIISSRDNQPIIAPMMNAPTFAQRLTRPGVVVRRDLIYNIYSMLTSINPYNNEYESITRISSQDEMNLVDLIRRLDRNGVPFESGRALFSLALPPDFSYDMKGVYINEGVLINGIVDKSTIGDKHRSIVQEIHKRYGPKRSLNFITDITLILDHWGLGEGHSVGISDCFNYKNELYISLDKDGKIIEHRRRVNIIEEESKKIINTAEVEIEAMNQEEVSDTEALLIENQIKGKAKNVITKMSKIAKDNLIGNNMYIQAEGGGKGSIVNVAQLGVAISQQMTHGKRFFPTLRDGKVVLSIFDVNEKSAESRGLAKHSFLQGLSPGEYYFHAVGSREGIIDTAIKTAPAGALQRSLIKNMEDLIIDERGSVSKISGRVLSFMYGNDSFEAKHLLKKSFNGEDLAVPIDVTSISIYLNTRKGWILGKNLEKMDDNLEQNYITREEKNMFPELRLIMKSTRELNKEDKKKLEELNEKMKVIEEIEECMEEDEGKEEEGKQLREVQKLCIERIIERKIEESGITGKNQIEEYKNKLKEKYNIDLVKTLEKENEEKEIKEVDVTIKQLAETMAGVNQKNIMNVKLRLLEAQPFKTKEHSKFIRKNIIV